MVSSRGTCGAPLPRFGRLPPLGVVDQDAPHQQARHAEELLPVLPVDLSLPHQAEVDLVDQGGRLEGVAVALPLEQAAGDLPQILEHERDEPLQGRGIALAPILEDLGNVH